MAEPKDDQRQSQESTGPGREARPQTEPAQEWGQREDHAQTVASGGKESEKGPAAGSQRP